MVHARGNDAIPVVLVGGFLGAGKTTLLNMLSAYIPDDQRVATVEDAAELQLQ